MQNKLYFCTNTKMSKGLHKSLTYLETLCALVSDLSPDLLELAVMLPYPVLYPARKLDLPDIMLLGAQNVCGEADYTFTGEIPAFLLAELGMDCVMAGHSERRHKLGETDTEINKKVLSALSSGLTVFLSISETAEEKNANISDETLRIQLKRCLAGINYTLVSHLRILYEPSWAIGKESSAVQPAYVGKRHQTIRTCLCEHFGMDAGSRIPLIYGGSVNADNALSLIDQPYIDGLGLGRSAWDAENFNRIIRQVIRHVTPSDRWNHILPE